VKFNLNDYNNNKNRQKPNHHIKHASIRRWSGSFEHEFDLDIKDPPCKCQGTAEINYSAYYDSGTWEDPPESEVELNAHITEIKCIKENGKEQLTDEELIRKVEQYLEEDEELQEKAFSENN
jgi:hypothetical protein